MKRLTLIFTLLVSAPLSAQQAPTVSEILRGGSDGWTANSFADAVTSYSPEIQKAEAGVEVAEAAVSRANVSLLPTLVLTGRYTRLGAVDNDPLFPIPENPATADLISGVDDPEAQALWSGLDAQNRALAAQSIDVPTNQWSFDAQIQIPLSDWFLTLGPTKRAAVAQTKANLASVKATENGARFEARASFYNLVRQRAVVALERERLQEAEERLRVTKAAAEVGAAKKSDLLRAESLVFQTRARLVSVSAAERRAVEVLRQLSGKDDRFETSEDVMEKLSQIVEQDDALVESALSLRDEQQVFEHTIKSLNERSRANRGTRLPSLRLGAGFTIANPNQRFVPQREQFDPSWEASAIVSWSPNSIVSGNANAKEIEARTRQVDLERTLFTDSVRTEVVATLADDRTAAAVIDAAESAVKASEEAYRLKRLEYEQGRATLTDLLDSETELTASKIGWIDAHINARVVRAKLSWITGGAVAAP